MTTPRHKHKFYVKIILRNNRRERKIPSPLRRYLRYPTESSNLLVMLFLEQTPELYHNACNISYGARCKVKKSFFNIRIIIIKHFILCCDLKSLGEHTLNQSWLTMEFQTTSLRPLELISEMSSFSFSSSSHSLS